MKVLQDEFDYSVMPIGESLLDVQAEIHRETGKVMRLVRLGAVSAQHLQRGQGSMVLLRGRGDALGPHGWPEGSHVAVPSALCPIAIVVDRAMPPGRAIMAGDGAEQRLVLCL